MRSRTANPRRTPGARPPARTAVGIAFTSVFAAQLGQIALTPVLTDVARAFDISTAAAGQVRTAAAVVAGLATLTVGFVAHRVGLRGVLAAGFALLGAGSAASAAAPSLLVLALGQAAVAAAWALLVAAGIAAAAEWSTAESRGRIVAFALVGAPLAWIVGLPALGLVADESWRAALALPALAAVGGVLALRAAPRSGGTAQRPALRAALRERALRSWLSGELLGYAGWSSALVYVGAHLVETYDTSTSTVGLVLGLGAAAYIPGTFAARRVPERHAAPLLAGLGGALAVSLLAWGAPRPGIAVTGAAFAVLCFFGGARTYLGSTLGLAVAGERSVEAMALRAFAAQAGTVLGTTAGGAALAVGGYPALAGTLAAIALAAAIPHLPALSAVRRSRAAIPRPAPRGAAGPARAR